MASLPKLTEDDIRHWVGDTSFERGRPYARDGSIFNQRRQGLALKAQCQGSLPHPYRVQAALGEAGIVAADCSCPVGAGGRCKHVAALLMLWQADPAEFVEIEDLETALERRSKPELIALIRQMVARYSDLELMLDMPAPGSSGQRKPLNPDLIRRQARAAFAGASGQWGESYGIAEQLAGLVRLGGEYAQAGDWRSAATVYGTVAQEILENFESVDDESGDLTAVVGECVAGLGECLDAAGSPAEREAVLRALFDVYRWDVEFGGIGMGDEAPEIIASHATPEERQKVAGWIRSAMPAGNAWNDSFHRQRYGGFLLDLEGDALDDEGFLRIAHETGRTRDLVDRLLDLGRVDEAAAEIRRADDSTLFEMVGLLMAKTHADLAARLVRERLPAARDSTRFMEWLKERASERGDAAEALQFSEALFWKLPTLSRYDEVRQFARARGSWDALRPELLARLGKANNFALLTEIHLQDSEIDQALKTLPKATGWASYDATPLHIRVAHAAEERYPSEAIRIYTAAAQQLIKHQGRDNYATAASYLARVRDLHRRLGEPNTWQALIADIRTQNKRLRALHEELAKAGL